MTTKLKFSHLFLLTVFIVSCSSNNDNDWKRNGLNGKVKSCFEKVYKVENKFGEWTKGDIEYYGHNKLLFTQNGSYKSFEIYDNAGNLFMKSATKYENNLLVEETIFDQNGKLLNTTKFNHISNRKLEYQTYNNGEMSAKAESFLSDGKITNGSITTFENKKATNEKKYTYDYDSNGNLLTKIYLNEKGEISSYERYELIEYDKQNNWTKKLLYRSEAAKSPENMIIREIEYY